jgi:hypothetical protein
VSNDVRVADVANIDVMDLLMSVASSARNLPDIAARLRALLGG